MYNLLEIAHYLVYKLNTIKRPELSYWLRVSDTQSEELNSLLAADTNDFLCCSVVHLGGISLV